MKINRQINNELVILVVAMGLIATFSAPWYELRGSYAAWRIDEWHTFWRGTNAFMLDSVVSANLVVPIEYATTAMQSLLQNMMIVGSVSSVWHGIAFIVLLVYGARMRLHAGVSRKRVALEIGVLVLVTLVILAMLGWLFTLPSSLTTKVDFRTELDVHTDSLIWSSVDLVFIVPGLAIATALAEIFLGLRMLKTDA